MNIPAAARTLLAGILDYAGTFPPASLALPAALAAYRDAAASGAAWMLGRLVVSAGALDAIASEPPGPTVVPLSVVVRPPHGLADVARWMRTAGAGVQARVESIEWPPMSPDAIREAASALPDGVEAFFEIPLDASLDGGVQAIADAGVMAKFRTGGVVAEAFPGAADLVRGLQACFEAGVACKATAGLHHALPGCYALTYEPGSAAAPMHGFLNVAIAAALVRSGDIRSAVEALDESAAGAFRFGDDGVGWHDRELSNAQLADSRRSLFRSFGSCSFREPVEELLQIVESGFSRTSRSA
jgi:hypothetical protein